MLGQWRQKNKTKKFMKRLFDSMFEMEGQKGGSIKIEDLRELVSEDPDTAAAAVEILLEAGDSLPGSRQLAVTLAAVVAAETEDDSLMLRAERALEAGGSAMPRVLNPDGTVPEATEKETLRVMQINPEDLESGNIYSITRLLAIDRMEDPGSLLPQLRGALVLAFPVDHDPRPIQLIPEVRSFIAALNEAMPYFPFYLNMRRELGMFIGYFGSLVGPEALGEVSREELLAGEDGQRVLAEEEHLRQLALQGREVATEVSGHGVNLMHPSLMKAVTQSAIAIAALCKHSGLDPKPSLEALLEPYPEEVSQAAIDRILEAAESV